VTAGWTPISCEQADAIRVGKFCQVRSSYTGPNVHQWRENGDPGTPYVMRETIEGVHCVHEIPTGLQHVSQIVFDQRDEGVHLVCTCQRLDVNLDSGDRSIGAVAKVWAEHIVTYGGMR
jgi:hypothetical protein